MKDAAAGTLLLILTGQDRPGVTRRVSGILTEHDVTILDIEQIVVRGHLMLSFLVSSPASGAQTDQITRDIREFGTQTGFDVLVHQGEPEEDAGRHGRIQVTVMGAPLRPAAIARVASEISDRGGNIDRIRRIASYPVTAVAFEGSGADVAELRSALAAAAVEIGVDIAVQAAGLDRRGQHLVVMDVDSTVIQDEVIDLLADEAGTHAQVAEITERAMAGQLDFSASLRARVALLEGLPADVIERVRERITLTPGARTLCRTLRNLGYRVALVSGGFTEVIAPLAAELGVDQVRANTLEIIDGRLTGKVVGDIVDRAGKRSALEEFAREYGIPMSRTIAIGDGANDVDMLQAAGLGIAFNGKAAARDAADSSVSVPYLDSVLYLMGISREEIEDADVQAGLSISAPPVS
ncbi:MAG: phosphoserine phosphatase SerB [Actinomycetes bacterium]